MSKQKIRINAQVYNAESDHDLLEIARSKGIEVPSTHLAFFKSIYAPIEDANRNKIRLSREAVEKSLPGLIGAQVNLEHFREGFIVGNVLDAWINANDEIEIIFTFFKSVYVEKFNEAKEKLESGSLSVSFELLSERSTQESLRDGTVRLNDIDFQGVGLLLDNPPAYPNARVFEMAKKYKDRVNECSNPELICANQILKTCDKILEEDFDAESIRISLRIRTSINNDHWHQAEIDENGNGETIGTFGEGSTPHTHPIINFEVQETNDHIHRLLNRALKALKEALKNPPFNKNEEELKYLERHKDVLKTEQEKAEFDKELENIKKDINEVTVNKGGTTLMNEEQKKIVAEVREELGDFAKDVSDEQLLDKAKVEELRKAKADAEVEANKEKSELEQTQEKINELNAKIEELEETIKAKDSEIESVRENAEKIGQLKVELKDNPHVKDFTSEDYLDETKVEKAKLLQERDELKTQNEELQKNKEENAKKLAEATKNKDTKDDVNALDESLETGEDSTGTRTFKDAIKSYYDKNKHANSVKK